MEPSLIYIILSLGIVSAISLIGVLTIALKKSLLHNRLNTLVAFAAGTFLGVAFFDLLPESVELLGDMGFFYVLLGLVIFFTIERFIQWHHCHSGKCVVHPSGYLNLIGDALHNFVDGIVVAAAFIYDTKLGILTTLAIALHEIPQEISDFAVLIHSGFSRKKALLSNFFSALTAILGGIVTFFFIKVANAVVPILIAIAAGNFLYMAVADIIPQLHKQTDKRKMIYEFLAFLIGIILVFSLVQAFPEEEPPQDVESSSPEIALPPADIFASGETRSDDGNTARFVLNSLASA